MKRIDGLNRAVDFFGPGKDGFRGQVPGVSLATQLTAKWFNGVQEAIIRTIEEAGITLSEADFDQFVAAIQWHAAQAASGKVTQGGGVGQIAGAVHIGAAAGSKLKADVGGVDYGNVAFEPWVAQQIAALVNASPDTLNTLKELADALGDDANFAATMTTALAGKERKFDSGTRMVFPQSSAPVGWTKVITDNDAALRVVSGAAGSGGSVNFSDAFVNGNVGATTLTTMQIPSHAHAINIPTYYEVGIGTVASGSSVTSVEASVALDTESFGGGQPHAHTLNLNVKYIDVIIASKD